MMVEIKGSVFTAYRNGTSIYSATIPDLPTSGLFGIGSQFTADTLVWDDVVVEEWSDPVASTSNFSMFAG
jgi:hypothetical protein